MADEAFDAVLANIAYVAMETGREPCCDDRSWCQYHQGFEDGYDAALGKMSAGVGRTQIVRAPADAAQSDPNVYGDFLYDPQGQ